MAYQGITTGTAPNDNTGDSLLDGALKINSNFQEIYNALGDGSDLVGGYIPVGGIIMWSGSVASIPSGWDLCNGSNGTPDLRNRFVVGAGSGYAVDATGGSADAIVVSHNHSATSTTTIADAGHNHGIADPGHNHGITDPGHVHNGVINDSADFRIPYAGDGPGTPDDADYTRNTLSATTGISINNNTTGVSVNNQTTGITASTSTDIDSQGSSGTNANLPPYYALAFIMRTS